MNGDLGYRILFNLYRVAYAQFGQELIELEVEHVRQSVIHSVSDICIDDLDWLDRFGY